jgi:hypothetical protein
MFASTADGVSHQKEINRLFEEYRIKPNDKCGFHIIAQYYGTPGDRFNIKKILQSRPLNDTSVVSPHGKFRIHFDTTNVNGNQPFLYDSTGQEIPNSTYALVDSVAEICDYVYHVEVDSFGYPPPPSDSGAGGGDEYDIYIQSLPTGIYGYPDWDPSKPLISRTNPTYAAWTVIRNEFQSTYTKGIPAIEVTIAHEFHHAIQVGNYGFWQNDLWFYELTSTWMEQVVYPEVKDYYQYLSNFFDNVDLPFNLYQPDDFEGYERCVFGIFLQNEPGYGAGLMKSIWESMVREPPIPAMEDAFVSDGKDPSSVFQLFAQLNYFTNYRTQLASKFNIVPYPLGNDYPLVKISGSEGISQSNSSADFSDMAMRLTEHFYQVSYQIFYQTKIDTDTVGIAVVNTNFSAAVNYDTTNYPFSVGISAGGSGCVRELTNGYCIFFETSDHTDWGIVPFITGNDTSLTFTMKDNIPFPQPFNPSSHTLKIPYSFPGASDITLAVFSTSGILLRKISSAGGTISLLGESYFEWDGRDETGKIVSSGIYIYVLTDGSKSVVGKIAVVRN